MSPNQSVQLIALQVARNFHSHENAAHEKRNQYGSKSKAELQDAIEPRHIGRVRPIEQDKSKSSKTEQETGGQAFHDVLAIDPVRHESLRFLMTLVVCNGADAWRLDDHVVNDASSDEKVGQ